MQNKMTQGLHGFKKPKCIYLFFHLLLVRKAASIHDWELEAAFSLWPCPEQRNEARTEEN